MTPIFEPLLFLASLLQEPPLCYKNKRIVPCTINLEILFKKIQDISFIFVLNISSNTINNIDFQAI